MPLAPNPGDATGGVGGKLGTLCTAVLSNLTGRGKGGDKGNQTSPNMGTCTLFHQYCKINNILRLPFTALLQLLSES